MSSSRGVKYQLLLSLSFAYIQRLNAVVLHASHIGRITLLGLQGCREIGILGHACETKTMYGEVFFCWRLELDNYLYISQTNLRL